MTKNSKIGNVLVCFVWCNTGAKFLKSKKHKWKDDWSWGSWMKCEFHSFLTFHLFYETRKTITRKVSTIVGFGGWLFLMKPHNFEYYYYFFFFILIIYFILFIFFFWNYERNCSFLYWQELIVIIWQISFHWNSNM